MAKRLNAEDQIERHAIHMLMDRNLPVYAMHILVALALAVYIAPAVATWRPVVFSIAVTAGLILQLWLAQSFDIKTADAGTFRRVRRRFDMLAIWIGSAWGFAGFFLFATDDPGRQVFLTFVMGGMALSSVATQGMRLRTCYSSIIPGMVPLGAAYLSLGTQQGVFSGLLIWAFLFVMVMLAQKINAFMLQAFRLQVDKDTLLTELRVQTQALEEARQAAEEANQAKSRFLAQASHDLRQPLHAISLFMESLPDAESEPEREAILERTRQSLDVLSQLFDSLLDVTLLDTGGMEVRTRAFPVGELMAELIRDFSQVAEAGRVELRSVPTRLILRSDPMLLRRVLQNLLSNAIRHSEGGKVLIGCRRQGQHVSIHVIDTGHGIDYSDQDRVFGEFTRLDADRMGVGARPGLGLGLSIVKRVSEELGLSVRLQSTPGRGSDFSIQGLERAPAEGRTTKLPPKTTTLSTTARIFVLDDDIETLDATGLLLRRWGYEVEASVDPEALLKARPEVVVCDYELSPKLTGLDVLDQLAELRGEYPRAVMISGHTSKSLRQAAEARGIPLLHKPLRPVQLRSALLNVLVGSEEAVAGGE